METMTIEQRHLEAIDNNMAAYDSNLLGLEVAAKAHTIITEDALAEQLIQMNEVAEEMAKDRASAFTEWYEDNCLTWTEGWGIKRQDEYAGKSLLELYSEFLKTI